METIQPTAGCSYVARVAFDVGERKFAPGDAVNCRELGIHEALMFGWWQAGMIAVAPTPAAQRPQQQHDKHRRGR